jgi:hypothetical protein
MESRAKMPKVTLNPLFESIEGKLEGYVFRRTPSGKTFMSYYEQAARLAHRTPYQMAISGNFRVHHLQLDESVVSREQKRP